MAAQGHGARDREHPQDREVAPAGPALTLLLATVEHEDDGLGRVWGPVPVQVGRGHGVHHRAAAGPVITRGSHGMFVARAPPGLGQTSVRWKLLNERLAVGPR